MCIFTQPVLNENSWSWVGVGVSVFLFGFFGVCISAYIMALPPTTYDRIPKFKWHNEKIYAIHLWRH